MSGPSGCLVEMAARDAAGGTSSARRRRERRQRSWWRHEQLCVAAALSAARHHSAGPGVVTRREEQQEGKVHEENDAPREPDDTSPGVRPGVPLDPGPPWVEAAAVGYVAASVPLLGAPSLADSLAEVIEGSTLSFLRQQRPGSEEEGGGGGGRGGADRSGGEGGCGGGPAAEGAREGPG